MINNKSLVSFDYAIKYLLKDKGDYSIVEGFISQGQSMKFRASVIRQNSDNIFNLD